MSGITESVDQAAPKAASLSWYDAEGDLMHQINS
jgi:hypothetical protein